MNEVLISVTEPHEIIIETAERLVESLPNEYIVQDDSLEVLTRKIGNSIGNQEIDKEAFGKALEDIPIHYKEQMLEIINIILERVFKTGLDYYFVLKHE